MLLTISTTLTPATDLGYLLHKHPDRLKTFAVAAGQAHVFYPEAAPERCTAALLLDVDPIGLVRGRQGQEKSPDTALAQYVNDRPYAASSMLEAAYGRSLTYWPSANRSGWLPLRPRTRPIGSISSTSAAVHLAAVASG